MVTDAERVILRDLARRVADIAALPAMEERRELWRRHNALQPVRPMLLVFPEGSWDELIPPDTLQCEGFAARRIELDLRRRIYGFEQFRSDNVVDGTWEVHKVIHNSGWGLAAKHVHSGVDRGAWGFDPVITHPRDLDLIQLPRITYDPDQTAKNLAAAEELFGDLLDVRLRGISHLSFHFMNLYSGWRGLSQVYLDMYENPGMLHDAMAILEAGYRGLVEQYVAQNLLCLNYDNTYHNSGGNGWLDAPPTGSAADPEHVTPADMWASAESQELDPVSPDFHRQFAMEYEARVLAPFGLTGYGCCDGLHQKVEEVMAIRNMRRISMSPFCKVDQAAPALGGRAIFSWKPQPAHLVGEWRPELIRDYIQHTLDVCREHGCVLEMILKDTHTCEHKPERFTAWTEIARSLVGEG